MIEICIWKNLNEVQKQKILQRPCYSSNNIIQQSVKEILQEVREKRDTALFALTKKWDSADLKSLVVSQSEINNAYQNLPQDVFDAMQFAIQQISRLHNEQKKSTSIFETVPGVSCERIQRPIEKVGFYIPGGTAPLVSTVLMLAIPAQIAGCYEKILCTPPNSKGDINPYILAAAKLGDVQKIYKCGGAQAIAAMAYGTESIPQVDKIFGPGNAYVSEAKKQVMQEEFPISCDLPAGPSELLIIADKMANAKIIASDLLSQAEHSIDAQVILITNCMTLMNNVVQAVREQLATLSRQEILNQSLLNARIIFVEDLSQAVAICNQYAPEHLSLQIADAEQYIPEILHAGTIFVGQYTAETFGDYVTGSNHVLPTAGYVRNYSGLSINDFMKFINIQRVTRQGFVQLEKYGETFACIEKLDAHRQAITVRRQELL